jgi:hypothetical protein
VPLSAEGSRDPDGDALSYRWFQYPEAGTFRGRIELRGVSTQRPASRCRRERSPGRFNIILELRDNGTPVLYGYRRIIVKAG